MQAWLYIIISRCLYSKAMHEKGLPSTPSCPTDTPKCKKCP